MDSPNDLDMFHNGSAFLPASLAIDPADCWIDNSVSCCFDTPICVDLDPLDSPGPTKA